MTRAYVLALRYIRDHLAIRDLVDDDSDITAEINMWISELTDEDSELGDALEVPKPPEQVFAWVTVNADNELTPESTINVGEWTWPVPERTWYGSTDMSGRIDEALSGHGWRVSAGGMELDRDHPGVVGVPVELGESSEPPF